MTSDPTTDSLRTGSTIGPWLLERHAGQGAYGAVFKVRHVSRPDSAPLALKLALAPNDQRLIREGELLSRLHHPSVPLLVDRGVWHSVEGFAHPYLVMQWIDGLPLYRWARLHAVSSRQVFRVLEQLAGALEVVHSAGARHRDVKGDNILVEPGGRAFLTDFGSGTWTGASPLTETVLPPGTRGYRGPEALRFLRAQSGPYPAHYEARTFDDLYGLGVSAYRLVTGEHPPPGTEPEARSNPYQAPLQARKPPQSLNPRVVPELAALIEQLLAAEPEARGSARQVAEAAHTAAEQAGPEADIPLAPPDAKPVAAPAPASPTPQKRPTRKQWKLGLLAISPLAMGAIAWLTHSGLHSFAPACAQEEPHGEVSVGDDAVLARVEPDTSEGGPKAFGEQVPAEPLPGQRRRPCRSREVEIRGGCWDRLSDVTPPCENDRYEWQGSCYLPKYERGHVPTSDKKKQRQ